jgi:acyl carrier protein
MVEHDQRELTSAIRQYIIDDFLLDEGELDDDTSLLESGIIDSTGAMEIVSFLETTFGIEVDDEDLVADNLDSVARLTRFVAGKQSAPARS